jgi:hypothetical protein
VKVRRVGVKHAPTCVLICTALGFQAGSSETLKKTVDDAIRVLTKLTDRDSALSPKAQDNMLPKAYIRNAHGLAFLFNHKVGLGVSVEHGTRNRAAQLI